MIGYYVHHQGDGHVTRAAAIARALGDEPVTRPELAPAARRLARRVGAARARRRQARSRGDRRPAGRCTGRRAGTAGLRERMAQIAAWVATHAPRLFVVDVSVEVTVLVRSMGVPTVVMGLPGVRDDAAHQLGYRLADAIIAPWPEWADVLARRRRSGARRRVAVGAISRFDGRAPAAAARARGGRRRVLRPVRAGRHGAHARRARRRPGRDARLDVDRARPARRPAGSPTRGRCCAPPTSSSPTRARTRSPTSRPRVARR